MVHPERQLSLLLRVHHRQGAKGHHSPGEHLGELILIICLSGFFLHARPLDLKPSSRLPFYQIRDVTDRSKQHCFELFCSGNEVIKACKTDSDGKVCILMFFYSKCSIFGLTCDDIDII